MRSFVIRLATAMFFVGANPLHAQEATGAKTVSFFGYDDCIELTNAKTRVVLCPAAGGRVLVYALDGKNALYLDESEAGFVWSPGKRSPMTAGRFDIGPEYLIPKRDVLWMGRWKGKVTGPRAATLTSQKDDATGVRLIRSFSLDANSTRLVCTQTIVNESEHETNWCHWARTFALGNGIAVVPLDDTSKFPNGYVQYTGRGMINVQPKDPQISRDGDYLIVRDVPKFPKLGMDSKVGWFAYLMPNDLMFVKRYKTFPNRVYNEAAGLTISIWYPEDRRVELEPIGPRETLQPGERGSFTEEWSLLPREFPADRNVDAEAVAKQVADSSS